MGVEGGIISVGAPVLGGGPSIGAVSGPSFVNEGPVAPAFLENTMPLTLNSLRPLGEIIFNPATSLEAAQTSLSQPVAEHYSSSKGGRRQSSHRGGGEGGA